MVEEYTDPIAIIIYSQLDDTAMRCDSPGRSRELGELLRLSVDYMFSLEKKIIERCRYMSAMHDPADLEKTVQDVGSYVDHLYDIGDVLNGIKFYLEESTYQEYALDERLEEKHDQAIEHAQIVMRSVDNAFEEYIRKMHLDE
ncbi:MAG: hypothetical protein ACOC32_02840 [Nanoarchaeota archaeon]